MILVRDLTVDYGEDRCVLNNLSLEVRDGDFIALMGANGSGKTTLTYCLAGIIPHILHSNMSGDVAVNGRNTRDCPVSELSTEIGFMMQDPETQFFTLSVEDEIKIPLENKNKDLTERDLDSRVEECLNTMGLDSGLRDKAPWELSEGQKQLLAMASILASNPKTLVLDEPTSQLDSENSVKVYEILGSLNRSSGKTVIVVEHDIRNVLKYASRVVILNQGKVVYDGKPCRLEQDDSGILAENGIQPPDYFNNYPKSQTKKQGKDGAILETIRLSYTYPENKKPAIHGIDLKIGKGDFILITGRTGGGKTTLVKHFNKLREPTSGDVLVNDKPTRNYRQKEISRIVGMVFQNPNHQIFENTVREEILSGLGGMDEEQKRTRLEYISNILNMKDLLSRNPHHLSGGEKQKTIIAAALAPNPDVLVLDEPTSHLDFHGRRKLMNILLEMRNQGKTIVVVTHDPGIFGWLSDKAITMEDGMIKESAGGGSHGLPAV